MPIGNMLSANEQQYVALRDDTTNTWRILNTWHDDIRNLDADSDIPDESPAVTVFSEGQFLALIKEAGRLGVLANASFGVEGVDPETELDMGILDRDKEIAELREKISTLEDEKSQVIRDSSHTEDYELKERAMTNILKLVSMQDMSNLSKE